MNPDLETVSVVLPARNEEEYIRDCINSLSSQDYPASLIEVIVVDNGSQDQTIEIAARMGVRVLTAKDVFVGAVRNFGASESNGNVIAFLDADCCAGPNWIREAVKILATNEVGAVGGVYRSGSKANWIQRTLGSNELYDPRTAKVLAGGSFILRSNVFRNIGGFDETLCASEDDELSRRLINNGYKLILTPECDVVHLGYPSTMRGVLKRQIWQGSSQLNSAERMFTPLVITTHIYLFSFGLVALNLFTEKGYIDQFLQLASAFIIFLFPAIMVFRKRRGLGKGKKARWLIQITQSYAIELTSLVGRGIGLIQNYMKVIKSSFS